MPSDYMNYYIKSLSFENARVSENLRGVENMEIYGNFNELD